MTATAQPVFAFRRTAPGMGLLWMAPPRHSSAGAAALRSQALYEGSEQLALQGLVSRLPALHELVLMDARQLTAAQRRNCLETLRKTSTELLLRLEFDAQSLEQFTLSPDELTAWSAVHPLFVHVLLEKQALPSTALVARLRQLADSGMPLAGDVILERGDGGDPQRLREFLLELVRRGVRPSHLISGAWLPASRQLPREQALVLMGRLRGWISGLAVPQLVRESETGRRTLLIPNYVRRIDREGVELTSYRGEIHHYPHPPLEEE
ncbi:MAG: hypothetical protein O7E56_14040 [SAR324 cluster bacterium]|nr:hypothetical protein [SAR324 cluster bacterium]